MTIHNLIIEFYKNYPALLIDLELIIAYILKKDRAFVVANPNLVLKKKDLANIRRLFSKRIKHIPLAYIFGYKFFCGIKIKVNKNVLIPRPETEILVNEVVSYCHFNQSVKTILDVGTGSGAIIIALAKKIKKPIKFFGSDISNKALALAKANSRLNKVSVKFLRANALPKKIELPFSVIVANLPYLSQKEYQTALKLYPEIKMEPLKALVANKNGLEIIENLLKTINRLKDNKIIFLEIGFDQADSIKKIARKYLPNYLVRVIQDDCGFDRFCEIKKEA